MIRTKGLTKYFGNFKVVNDLTLNVKKGEIYGFLGANGAGKTTMTCPPKTGPVVVLDQGPKKGGLKWPEEATDQNK